MACPRCHLRLALAESERILGLVTALRNARRGWVGRRGNHHSRDRLPNGCAGRTCEIGLVGNPPTLQFGWRDVTGTRLNRLWKDVLKNPI